MHAEEDVAVAMRRSRAAAEDGGATPPLSRLDCGGRDPGKRGRRAADDEAEHRVERRRPCERRMRRR